MPEAIDHGRILQPNGGRDELNLAEFPITLLADRVPDGCTEITFEDEVYDHQAGEKIKRRLTVKGDKEYGLPTAIDDEVLFALIQITKLYNDFREREVKFSRYEVLRLLGWRDDSVNYRRLSESLRRWKRVNLSYEKAWWNKLDQTWMTEEFNIIDNLSIPEDTHRGPGRPPKRRTHATTSFHWNKVVFQSFQAENLKRIDAKTYFSLKSSVAKRMYRFLDKRFYHKLEWPFDLHDFAFEHVGLSRSYEKNAGKIKEKLQPGLDELEAIGFISPLPKEKRYTKTGTRWTINLGRNVAQASLFDTPARAEPVSDIVKELIQRGVTEATAVELASNHDAATIEAKLEVLDWLAAKKDKRVSKSPAGYLVDSIRKGYVEPKGFESKAARAEREKQDADMRKAAEEKRRKQAEKEAREKAEAEAKKARIDAYWMSLTPTQQAELMAAAMEANPEERENIEEQRRRRLMWFVEAMEKNLRNNYIERLLVEKTPA
jgi:hypothetical protein